MQATVAPNTLQAELDQPMSPFTLDAPGGEVSVYCRSCDHSLEMRGYRVNAEGRDTWVGPSVSVCLPQFHPWGDGGDHRPAYVSHSSSSSNGVEGDTEVAIELLRLAVEIKDQLNAEAEVALAPLAHAYEEQRARYEREAEELQKFRAEQAAVLEAAANRGKLRVYTATRKTPYQVGTINSTKVTEYGTEKPIPFSQIERVEIQLNGSGKFGKYGPCYFPTERLAIGVRVEGRDDGSNEVADPEGNWFCHGVIISGAGDPWPEDEAQTSRIRPGDWGVKWDGAGVGVWETDYLRVEREAR